MVYLDVGEPKRALCVHLRRAEARWSLAAEEGHEHPDGPRRTEGQNHPKRGEVDGRGIITCAAQLSENQFLKRHG